MLQNVFVAAPPALTVLAGAIGLNLLLRRALRLLAAKSSFANGELMPVERLGHWLINGAALVLLLGVLGFNLGGLWAMFATVLGMVAIGFVAVWSVLSNALCTLIILISRPFEVGDDVEFAGEPVQGKVVDLNFIYTSLRARDGSLLQVPNNLFLQKVVRRHRAATGVTLTEQLHADAPMG
jgi:small-conductance mechanosensitive channel